MDGRFGIAVGGFAVHELDDENRVEIPRLDPGGLEPNVLDAGNLRGHLGDPVNHSLRVGIRNARTKLDDRNGQDRFRLADPRLAGAGLAGGVTCDKKRAKGQRRDGIPQSSFR